MKEAIASLLEAIASAERTKLPDGADFHYYNTMEAFRDSAAEAGRQLQRLAAAAVPTDPMAAGSAEAAIDGDAEDLRRWVVERMEDALERCDAALDAAQRAAKQPQSDGASQAIAAAPVDAAVTAAATAQAAAGSHGRFAASVADIPKPQERFDDAVDNSDAPFVPRPAVPPWSGRPLPGSMCQPPTRDADGSIIDRGGFPHPLRDQLDALVYPAWQLEAAPPRPPQSLEATPFSYVDTPAALQRVAARLASAREVAVDLEAHSFRSYQGFVCLMQLSTREEDIVIDALALRSHIGAALGPIFADASTVKVLHGADHDTLWLQRDFGVYVVNMFDTGQAARVLQLPGLGLKYLLQHFCGVQVNKAHQLADWRVRPLDPALLAYARQDTHHLLYIADRLKVLLVEAGNAVPAPLDPWAAAAEGAAAPPPLPPPPPQRDPPIPSRAMAATLERSRQLCLQRYEKEVLDEARLQGIYATAATSPQRGAPTPQQRAATEALHVWRDGVAREEDESTGYVLPRKLLARVATGLPTSLSALRELVGPGAKVVLRRAAEVLAVIAAARQAPDVRSPQLEAPTPRQPPAISSSAKAAEAADCAADQGPVKRTKLQARRVGPVAAAGGSALLQNPPATPEMLSALAQLLTATAEPTAAGVSPARASQAAPAAADVAAGSLKMAPVAAGATAGGRLRPRAVQSIAHSSGSGLLGGSLAASMPSAQPWQPAAAARAVQPELHQAAASTAQGALAVEAPSPTATVGNPPDPGTRPAADSSAEARAHQEAVQRLRSSFQLPFARMAEAAAPPQYGDPAAGSAGDFGHHAGEDAAAAAAAPQRTSGADIRAFVDSMPDAGAAAGPPAAARAEAVEAAAAEAQEAAPQRTDFLAAGPNYLDLSQLSEDFAPLSSRGAKQGKKRQRQAQQRVVVAGASAAGGSGGGDALQATYRRVGLDSDSDSGGNAVAPPQKQQKGRGSVSRKPRARQLRARQQAGEEARPQQRQQQPGAAAVEDVEAARAGAPGLNLRMSAGRAAGRGGRGGRGDRGRGRGAANVEAFHSVPPPASAGAPGGPGAPVRGPYGMAEAGLLKGGKRSATAPRSGNKQMTFGS